MIRHPPAAGRRAALAAAALRFGLALVLPLAGCAAPRPSELPSEPEWIVVVKSARLTPRFFWLTRFAHHTWIDFKAGSEAAWRRVEVRGRGRGVVVRDLTAEQARRDTWYGDRPVHILETFEGEPARRIAEAIVPLAQEQHERYSDGYLMWPGPNSNTFMSELAGQIPELAFVLDANAVGKDWPGWLDVGRTTSKTGVRLDTPVAGAAVALREGVELHALGLTFGVRLFPPSLALPFLPRIPDGFAAEWREPAPAPPVAPDPAWGR